MVAADRNNAETNPTTGVSVTYGGAASIWQADGRRTAHSPATGRNISAANPGTILYGEIDPELFDNDQKRTTSRRRPELYRDLTYFRAPTDTAASRSGVQVNLDAVQYRQVSGDVTGNIERADALITQVQHDNPGAGLLVLPAFTFHGYPRTREQAEAAAEPEAGRTVQLLSDFATRTGRHIVGSHVERVGGLLFHSVVLMRPDGTIAGTYRQTHLDPAMEAWATPGDDLAVFETELGRVGLLTCEDVRFPEASGVLAVNRADLIAIPTHWTGSYGGWLHDAGGLFAHKYPENTMCMWYAIAKTSQAYTVVANPVDDGCQGSSGVFTIDPVDSQIAPVTAATDDPAVATLTVSTLAAPGAWMSQERLIGGRRPDLCVPLALDPQSGAFKAWRAAPGFRIDSWSKYDQ